MKPTKEQLADPKWWDANSDGFDFLYECESTDEIVFANREGKDTNGLRLRLELDIWKLLAKRPEPEWVPEVGECFEFSANGVSWEQREMLYADDYSILMANKKYPANRWHYKTNDPNLMYKPIKTKREELIDIIDAEVEDDMGIVCIADAILARFDLTGKDGN